MAIPIKEPLRSRANPQSLEQGWKWILIHKTNPNQQTPIVEGSLHPNQRRRVGSKD